MSKILIVEDEQMLSEMYKERFEADGIEIAVAESAEEGLEKFETEQPDLVLLDILLPRENGITFVKKLKEQHGDELPVPIVAFSNYDEKNTRTQAERLGVREYLIKTDFTPAEIAERVKQHLSDATE